MVARHGLEDSCYVISFFPQALWHLRRANPRLRTCMLVRRRFLQPLSVNPSTRDDCHWLVRTFPALADLLLYWSCRTWLPSLLGVSMVGPESTISSPDMVERFRKRGVCVPPALFVVVVVFCAAALLLPPHPTPSFSLLCSVCPCTVPAQATC